MKKPKLKPVLVKLTEEQHLRLKEMTDKEKHLYPPTIQQIVTRGIQLALAELEQRKKGK